MSIPSMIGVHDQLSLKILNVKFESQQVIVTLSSISEAKPSESYFSFYNG